MPPVQSFFLHDEAVFQAHQPVRHRGMVWIVRHHKDGLLPAIDEFAEQGHDLIAVGAVEVSRRFIGQDEKGIRDQGTSDG